MADQALLTAEERNKISGRQGEEKKDEAVSQIHRRIKESVTTDTKILRRNSVDLYSDLVLAVCDTAHVKMGTNRGGEIAEFLADVKGERYRCDSCGETSTVYTVLGHPEEGGRRDRHGGEWRLYIECPSCGSVIEGDEIKQRIDDV